MKELSIKEKAKAYDLALERAIVAHKDEDRHLKATLERIFPELIEESEDEQIRKALINMFKGYNIQKVGDFTDKEIIAWLEKQGESTDINPSEFDLRLNKLLKQFETLPKEELASSLSFYLNVVQNNGTYREEKQGEQDMIPLDKAIKFLDEQLVNDKDEVTGEPFINFQNYGSFKETFISYFKRKMLEKQGEQKPAWSEEDSPYYDDICEILRNLILIETDKINKDFIQKDLDWLKSLKERCTWKPSEIQLQCLYDAIEHYQTNGYPASKLTELYEQMSNIYKL